MNTGTNRGHEIWVGKEYYESAAKGAAMGDPKGFVKVIVEQKTRKTLGGHIIGPFAPVSIQGTINAMNVENNKFMNLVRPMHTHQAMSEMRARSERSVTFAKLSAFRNLQNSPLSESFI
jgi:dihydrolipoamide dehydrogenase